MTTYILCIESSTSTGSVAIYKDYEELISITSHIERAHAKTLTRLIEQCIQLSSLSYEDLSAVAISAGPGSYTGLRIGASIAKGIAFAQNIPLISINTLEILAHGSQLTNFEGYYIPMIDARRDEVYCSIYNHKLKLVQPTQALILDSETFTSYIKDSITIISGDGSIKAQRILGSSKHLYSGVIHPLAKDMGKMAFQKFTQEEFEDLAYWEPNYLKEFKAGKPKPMI